MVYTGMIYQLPQTPAPAALGPAAGEIDPKGQGTPIKQATAAALDWVTTWENWRDTFTKAYPVRLADPADHNAAVDQINAEISNYDTDKGRFAAFMAEAGQVFKAATDNAAILIDVANQAADKELWDDAAELAAIAQELTRLASLLNQAMKQAADAREEARTARNGAAQRANIGSYDKGDGPDWKTTLITVAAIAGIAFIVGNALQGR